MSCWVTDPRNHESKATVLSSTVGSNNTLRIKTNTQFIMLPFWFGLSTKGNNMQIRFAQSSHIAKSHCTINFREACEPEPVHNSIKYNPLLSVSKSNSSMFMPAGNSSENNLTNFPRRSNNLK